MEMKHPRLEIEYCKQCRWLLRLLMRVHPQAILLAHLPGPPSKTKSKNQIWPTVPRFLEEECYVTRIFAARHCLCFHFNAARLCFQRARNGFARGGMVFTMIVYSNGGFWACCLAGSLERGHFGPSTLGEV
jgi:hypothetical protein